MASPARAEQGVAGVRPAEPIALGDPRLREVYRQVYVSLELPAEARSSVIGITSAIGGEGRTTVACGLAETLARDLSVPVSLVEVDFERPALALHFDIAPAPGLCEVLRGEYGLAEVARPVGPNLMVVTAGHVGPHPARLLHQLATHNPLDGPDSLAGVVILDLPPLVNQSWSALAAGIADAVVLVVRAGVTPAGVVREAIARLDARPQGVILNSPRPSRFARLFGRAGS